MCFMVSETKLPVPTLCFCVVSYVPWLRCNDVLIDMGSLISCFHLQAPITGNSCAFERQEYGRTRSMRTMMSLPGEKKKQKWYCSRNCQKVHGFSPQPSSRSDLTAHAMAPFLKMACHHSKWQLGLTSLQSYIFSPNFALPTNSFQIFKNFPIWISQS